MKKLIKILIIMCVLLQMFGCKARTEKSSGLYIEFLSTGKSDCAIIQADELNIICDTAYEWNYSQIEERLKVLGIVSIDVMILTHFDKDHIGSAGHIINEIDVETVYMPDYEEESEEYETIAGWLMDTVDVLPQVGDCFEIGGFRFTVEKMRRHRISSLRVICLEMPKEVLDLE